jgi:hypothetical protein
LLASPTRWFKEIRPSTILHVEGGSLAEILAVRSATKWLRL